VTKRFQRRRSVAASLRRIALTEIDVALAAIGDRAADEAETIHTVRQQMKRLRALIRLPHQRLAGWREENIAFRDLARRLAGTRDAEVLGETFDQVADTARLATSGLRAALVGRQAGGSHRDLLAGEITAGLLAARSRIAEWRFHDHGFALIGRGLRRVYADMGRSEAAARAAPDPARFHEWRKQTKYHAAQLRLLRPIAPAIIKGYLKAADALADTLGAHHDLDVLASAVNRLAQPAAADRDRLLAAIRDRNATLEAEAFRLGDELTAERPVDFLHRIEASWKSWRR